jgi:hypothetical protein
MCSIDIFVHRMTHRFRLHLEFWAIVLFVFPFCALLFWFGFDFAERAFVRNEGPGGRHGPAQSLDHQGGHSAIGRPDLARCPIGRPAHPRGTGPAGPSGRSRSTATTRPTPVGSRSKGAAR